MSAPVWWWLSFANEAGFLGVAIVRAPDMVAAVRAAHRLRCNPGGEVNGWPVPEDAGLGDPRAIWVGRLLNKAEADEMSREWTGHPIVGTADLHPGEAGDPGVLDEPDNEGQ